MDNIGALMPPLAQQVFGCLRSREVAAAWEAH